MINLALRLGLYTLLTVMLAALLGGCAQLWSTGPDGVAPRSQDQWTSIAGEIRAFERRIGFEETNNFLTFAGEHAGFPFCGHVSRLYLPYSYDDPAIQWVDSVTEDECRALGNSADVSFGISEALGKRETPVTAAMLSAPLDRLVYLVIHEDCHEQFELPAGIEEALCNVITFKAMAVFNEERFRSTPRERRAIQRYAREGAEHSRLTIAIYAQLAALYARHDQSKGSSGALFRERDRMFRKAERELAWPKGSMNNVWIANTMTYSRHYPLMERVFEALGRDLARTVDFFRRVDALKPSAAEVVTMQGLTTDSGLDFIRAYEAAVIETIEQALEAEGALLHRGAAGHFQGGIGAASPHNPLRSDLASV